MEAGGQVKVTPSLPAKPPNNSQFLTRLCNNICMYIYSRLLLSALHITQTRRRKQIRVLVVPALFRKLKEKKRFTSEKPVLRKRRKEKKKWPCYLLFGAVSDHLLHEFPATISSKRKQNTNPNQSPNQSPRFQSPTSQSIPVCRSCRTIYIYILLSLIWQMETLSI